MASFDRILISHCVAFLKPDCRLLSSLLPPYGRKFVPTREFAPRRHHWEDLDVYEDRKTEYISFSCYGRRRYGCEGPKNVGIRVNHRFRVAELFMCMTVSLTVSVGAQSLLQSVISGIR